MKKLVSTILLTALSLSALCVPASAKTQPNGQTVDMVLFWVTNSAGEDVLVSHTKVSEMEADMQAGKISAVNHNYSVLDKYVTTLHQEAQGFTVPEFVTYAQEKSTLPALQSLNLRFAGRDEVAFWEIDDDGYDELDTYTYADLYGVARYNFPLLYEYWNYKTQDYYDPAGNMSREQVIDYIFDHGEPETWLLSVRAFSQRFQATGEKYGAADYNMENYWQTQGLMDNERTIRLMAPMTEAELRGKVSTAFNTRYWVANIRLSMQDAPQIQSLGNVAAPTATMTEDDENYYIRFSCATEGATILYNQNYLSVNYTPTKEYDGRPAVVPKQYFKDGEVTITCRAVKDGYSDGGVTTLKLRATGAEAKAITGDVAADAWYAENVRYVLDRGLFDLTGADAFSPEAPMTRAMLATALYRMAGSPKGAGIADTPLTDVSPYADYAEAVAWCYASGVVSGYEDGTFRPSGSITREQIAAMFCRYAEKIAGADMTASNDLSAYTDKGIISGWALDNVRWAVGAGLITGMTTDTIAPQGTATRAQTAAMVQRLAGHIGG